MPPAITAENYPRACSQNMQRWAEIHIFQMTHELTVAKYYTLRKKANIKRVLRHIY